MSQKTIRRVINPETRIIDAEKGICEYVASDQTLDYSREIIRADGWKFTNFQRNAPFVDSHDYHTIEKQLGTVISYKVEKGQLIERVKWAIDVPDNDLARFGWNMVVGGYLKACSVGFYPTSMVTRWDDEKSWGEAVRDLGVDADTAAKVRCIYIEHEQIELSACILGCNPSALVRAYKDGALSDEDMYRAGFGDADDFNFITSAAKVYDAAPGEVRAIMHAAIARIFADRPGTKNLQENQPSTAPAAKQPAGADGADDRRKATEFMENFNSSIKTL